MVFFVPLSRIIAIVGIVFAAIGVVLNLIALDIPRIIGGIISVAIRYFWLLCCEGWAVHQETFLFPTWPAATAFSRT